MEKRKQFSKQVDDEFGEKIEILKLIFCCENEDAGGENYQLPS